MKRMVSRFSTWVTPAVREMVEHHVGEVGGRGDAHRAAALAVSGGQRIGQLVLLGGHDAVRREALHRERPGDAHPGIVHVGPVVEVLDIGRLGDRGVDPPLPLDARLPPGGVQLLGGVGPRFASASRGIFPLLPVSCPSALLSCSPQRLQGLLVRLPDDVDLGVVGDGLERDMRRALVDEALADVAVRLGMSARILPETSCSLARPSLLSARW